MAEGRILGKEQLILLPVENKIFTLKTDPPGQVKMHTGNHAVVFSGILGVYINSSTQSVGVYTDLDDDVVLPISVVSVVGPRWRAVQQVSASVTMAGIISRDSDEVDHSRWVVGETTWEEVQTPEGIRIRLTTQTDIQGQRNGWLTLAYQVVATGYLRPMPTPDEVSADLS
jgi:hypothetical protein